MDSQLERSVESAFVRWLASVGGRSYKWTGCRYKLDRVVITHTGVICLMEFKRPLGGRTSHHQNQILRDAHDLRAPAYTCRTLEQAIRSYQEAAALAPEQLVRERSAHDIGN